MTFRIIRNGNPFETETFRELLRLMSGGNGGLISGLDADQDDWVNSSTDVLKFSPGSYIWRGEIVKILTTIEINGIFNNTSDGDWLYFYHAGDDATFVGAQIGWGKISSDSDNILLARRKNNLWWRVPNVMKNIDYRSQGGLEMNLDTELNRWICDFPDPVFWDGVINFDETHEWDGTPV